MNLHEIYFELRPEDIAYVKFILESYEVIGLIRTIDRKKAIIVVLIVEDFLAVGRSLMDSLRSEIELTEIPRPADVGDDWLMKELATESPSE
ncbi:MAG TPA: DUF4911 domain-containing protein [Candidatus Binatia bacterium]|jgi:hypothetical protein